MLVHPPRITLKKRFLRSYYLQPGSYGTPNIPNVLSGNGVEYLDPELFLGEN